MALFLFDQDKKNKEFLFKHVENFFTRETSKNM